jgi:hypothetical protein
VSDVALTVWLVICGCSVVIANVLHFRMKFRLDSANLPVKWLITPRDDYRMWKTYRLEAPDRDWPLWPFFAYRIVLFLFILSAVVLMVNVERAERIVNLDVVFGKGDWIIAWSYLTSLVIAVAFTARFLSKLPARDAKNGWQRVFADEYRRNDLYVALLGWFGLVMIYFAAPTLREMVGR